jgi:DNA-binding Lrp family transcriptional regulator
MNLDDIDLRIILILLENARASTGEIAKALGLTRPTVRKRIARLESEGYILGYRAVLSPSLTGGTTFLVRCRSPDLNALQSIPGVREIMRTGESEYILKVTTDDASRLREIGSACEAMEVIPVLEHRELPPTPDLKVTFRCDYCGKEVVGSPLHFKAHNRHYLFCCPVCLRQFRKATGSASEE